MFDPRRKKERRLIEEPMDTKSRTLKLDPRRVSPYMLSEDPQRTKDRRLTDEPNCTKSKTLRLEPRRHIP
jgi:hypothetical protein